jgi:hypothetical protein
VRNLRVPKRQRWARGGAWSSLEPGVPGADRQKDSGSSEPSSECRDGPRKPGWAGPKVQPEAHGLPCARGCPRRLTPKLRFVLRGNTERANGAGFFSSLKLEVSQRSFRVPSAKSLWAGGGKGSRIRDAGVLRGVGIEDPGFETQASFGASASRIPSRARAVGRLRVSGLSARDNTGSSG